MLRRFIGDRAPVAAGAGALVVVLSAILLMPAATLERMRESAFDLVLAADQRWRKTDPHHTDPQVVVIDIDRRSIEAVGAWPWPRETMALLLETAASAKPAAVAIDVLFAEPDSRPPAALARQLGAQTGRPELAQLAESLPDGDKRLAQAARDLPVAFGFVLDLADHARRAVDCAIAISTWSKEYQRRQEPAALGFGRTRVGVETGLAVVGDVGIQAKLNYTAYGDALNVTARLEAANKELGSEICVGPTAAARCDSALLRPLGVIAVRGREGPLAVFEPWRQDAPAAWRERYLKACHSIEGDRRCAIEMFEALAAERSGDPVPRQMAQRLRAEG